MIETGMKIFSWEIFQSRSKNLSRQKYVKMQENGIQMKNRISSIGSSKILKPVIYLSLNHHTPVVVNHISQPIKTRPTMKDDRKNAPKYLLNLIFG